ncbi:MAG: tRNA (N(6)-L-threonylcarbamoyladenosine(37)-C(2))-methylthiotransferase MtaB [Cytophagales bacterium]
MKKVAFYTLGCKLNFSETSTISRIFEDNGYKKVEFTDTPDIFIINTCSVTDNADKKCKKVVKEAKKISKDSFVAIIGCYAQLKPEEIVNIDGVDAVLGASEKFRLIEVLNGFSKENGKQVFAKDIEEVNEFESSYSINDRTRTFLKVQDGCDYTCSFCTIPLARGKSRSDYSDKIVEQAKEIAQKGVKEIVLTGVNIGDFGLHNGVREEKLIDLLRKLDDIDGVNRYRISSIEPNLLTDEIIEFVAASKKFVPHFHIPLQSGNDKMLALMRRRYKRDVYRSRVSKIRELMPDACIGVDVITGFPGETDEDFKVTYEFITELEVSYLHVFTYSERDNTFALNLEGVVPQNIRNERTSMLRTLSEKKKRAFYQSQIGNEAEVLFESDVVDGYMFGFSTNYVKAKAKYDPILVGEIKRVKMTSIDANGDMELDEVFEYEKH